MMGKVATNNPNPQTFTTGIPFVDSLLGGGHAPGEVHGLMGPYGSCKTMLAVALSVEACFQCHKIRRETGEDRCVLLFSYDAPPDEIWRRTRSYAAEVDLHSLEQIGTDGTKRLSTSRLKSYEKELFAALISHGIAVPGENGRLNAVDEVLKRHLIPVDYYGTDKTRPQAGEGYVREATERIKEELRQRAPGAKPHTVILDYVGRMCEAYLSAKGEHGSPVKLIGQAPRLARQTIAQPFQCPVWLVHQLNTDANSHQDVTRRHHHEEAADSKHFGDRLDAALIAGVQDEEHRFAVMNSKAVRDPKEVLVQMRGEIGFVGGRNDALRHHWLQVAPANLPKSDKRDGFVRAQQTDQDDGDHAGDSAKQRRRQSPCLSHITRTFKPRTGPNADCFHPELDSRQYLKRSKRGHSRAKAEWHETPAYRMLRPGKGHSGLWLPEWLREVTMDPWSRRLQAFVLFYFDDKSTRSAAIPRNRLRQSTPQQIRDIPHERLLNRRQRCRARAMRDVPIPCTRDGEDVIETRRVRCLDKPLAKIAAAAGLSEKQARRAMQELVKDDILRRAEEPGHNGILLYPNGYTLACRYLKYRGIPEDEWPEPYTSLVIGWYESDYRREALNRDGRKHHDLHAFDLDAAGVAPKPYRKPVARGTWVDDLIYAICGERAGPAHLMSQLLWWFDGRKDQKTGELIPRASLVRDGRRWVFMSVRQLARSLGYPRSSVADWLDWLVDEKEYFKRRMWPVAGWNTTGAGVDHYSPEPDMIYKALRAAGGRAKELRYARFEGLKDERIEV